MPRLELLGAVLLSRLISSIREGLGDLIKDCICFTDSLVTLHWIKGTDRSWKPFIQNRVMEIRGKVPIESWRHCSGRGNPADLPSRGTTLRELQTSKLWFYGPDWYEHGILEPGLNTSVPPECLVELRARDKASLTLTAVEKSGLSLVMDIKRFSHCEQLLRATACILSFLGKIKKRLGEVTTGAVEEDTYTYFTRRDLEEAEVLWIKEAQRGLIREEWKSQFQLYQDEQEIWRCWGRLGNADLPFNTRYPMLLPKTHRFTELVVRRSHLRVLHSGAKDTLTKLRSKFWIPGGRSLVRQLIKKCVICRRYNASYYRPPLPPPLPVYRVKGGLAFTSIGIDYAGPVTIKHYTHTSHHTTHTRTKQLGLRNAYTSYEGKAWVSLFTCCTSRAVHLDVVMDLTAKSFIRCFKRFISRRGLPTRIISDNGSTFKASAKILQEIFSNQEVKRFLSNSNIIWVFNIERAPWWRGFFERLIQSLKRCLRKMVGRAKLTYEELVTEVAEVELILNSRPLTYISGEDMDEPLTPSHLICGRHLMSLPDHLCYTNSDDEDYRPHTSTTFTKRVKYLNAIIENFWT